MERTLEMPGWLSFRTLKRRERRAPHPAHSRDPFAPDSMEGPALQQRANLTEQCRSGRSELMDYDGGRGHRNLHCFRYGCACCQRRCEVGCYRVAGADDVYRTAHGQGRDMLHFAIGRRSEDAAVGQGDKDAAALLACERCCDGFDIFEVRILLPRSG